ncbi:MAG: hypothetical protein NVSMB30_20520 [Hymenobacter sp.]
MARAKPPNPAVGLSKFPTTYTLGPLTATARATSLPAPPAARAHTKVRLALLHLATNASAPTPAVLVRVVAPKPTVPTNCPTRYTLPLASAAVAFTCDVVPLAWLTATTACQAGAWARASGPPSSPSSRPSPTSRPPLKTKENKVRIRNNRNVSEKQPRRRASGLDLPDTYKAGE